MSKFPALASRHVKWYMVVVGMPDYMVLVGMSDDMLVVCMSNGIVVVGM